MALLQQIRRKVPLKKVDLPAVVIIFAIPTLLGISAFDLVMHDTFVLTTYRCDDPANKNTPDCAPINAQTTLQASFYNQTIQYKVTGRGLYWVVLNALIFTFSFLPSFIRGFLLGSAKAGFLWFITILLPIVGGYEDFLYFTMKNMPLPDKLPWLNDNVFINIFAQGQTVTATTVYTSMAAVVVILALAWGIALRKN